jgi:hypothetical protein
VVDNNRIPNLNSQSLQGRIASIVSGKIDAEQEEDIDLLLKYGAWDHAIDTAILAAAKSEVVIPLGLLEEAVDAIGYLGQSGPTPNAVRILRERAHAAAESAS